MIVYTKDMDYEAHNQDMSNHYLKNEQSRYTEAYMKYKGTMRKFDSFKPQTKAKK
jgi:hypothetical protein